MINQSEIENLTQLLNGFVPGNLVATMKIVESCDNLIKGEETNTELKQKLTKMRNYFSAVATKGASDSIAKDLKEFNTFISLQNTVKFVESEKSLEVVIAKDEIDVLKVFISESLESLNGIEQKILKLESHFDKDLVNSIFRPVHTIKGSCGFFGFKKIKKLSHELESLLDDLRQGKLEVDSDLVDILLEATDVLSKMIEDINNETSVAVQEGKELRFIPSEVDITDILLKIGQCSRNSKEASGGQKVNWEVLNIDSEMKKMFIEEANDHLFTIESLLISSEETKSALEGYDELFRSLHSIKGNLGLLISTVKMKKEKGKHILLFSQEMANLAESVIQNRRDSMAELDSKETDLLLQVVDFLKEIVIYLDTGEKKELNPFVIIANFKKINSTVISVSEKKSKKENDARIFAYSNTLSQSIEMITQGIDNLKSGKDLEKNIAILKRAFTNIYKLGKSVNHKLLLAQSTKGLKLLQSFKEINSEQQNSNLINDLNNIFQIILEKGERRKHEDVKDVLKKNADKKDIKPSAKYIKISEEHLDVLMNLVMELVVVKNNYIQVSKDIQLSKIDKDVDIFRTDIKEIGKSISKITYELQNNVMQMRMVPVGTIFSRFPRLVRDLSKTLEKKIELHISGEETKLDKTIVDSLGDPLVHIIRNSIDHGIGIPEKRKKKGKSEIGVISLSAFNMGQNVVIEIKDDGNGIDKENIKSKAIEKGFIDKDKAALLSDQEIYGILFLPGFSTASTVTDISGRGVGMDVVKTNIKKLSGSIQLTSELGVGTTIQLKLPLTLAITRGLEIIVEHESYYIPLENVLESVRLPLKNVKKYKDVMVVCIRGKVIPLYSIKTLLGTGNEDLLLGNVNSLVNIVVLTVKGRTISILVDKFSRENEFVIKPLPASLSGSGYFSGLTITGKGKIILVIDPLKIF